MKKVRYVQLEPEEVLLDFYTSRMTAEQFGCYWLLIIYLYCNNGRLKLDLKKFAALCNCPKNFEKVWEKIESKFKKTGEFITQKRVTNELRRAKRFIQHQQLAGFASAKARVNRLNRGSTEAQPSNVNEREVKESKENRNEVKVSKAGLTSVDSDFSFSLSSISARPASPKTASRGGSSPSADAEPTLNQW